MEKQLDSVADCATAYADAVRKFKDRPVSLDDAEHVLRARVGLVDCLVAAGWTAPPGVARDVEMDRLVLNELVGCFEGRCDPPSGFA